MRLLARDTFHPQSEAHYASYVSFRDIATTLHCHDFYEFFLIASGKIIHRINGEALLLKAGAFVFIRPDDEHAYRGTGDGDCQLVNLAYRASTLDALFDYLGEGFKPQRLLQRPMPPTVQLSTQDTQRVTARLDMFNRTAAGDEAYKRTALRMLLFDLFTWLFPADKPAYRQSGIKWLDNLVAAMHKPEHFVAGIPRMQALADCSPEHLARTFKANFEITPTEFVNELRLRYAANLLVNSDRPIIDVAQEAGFGNLSYFYRLFKQQFNTTPKTFRQSRSRTLIP